MQNEIIPIIRQAVLLASLLFFKEKKMKCAQVRRGFEKRCKMMIAVLERRMCNLIEIISILIGVSLYVCVFS